jgi:hypothetical protein
MYCNKGKICSITLMFRASEASCGEENGRKKETARRVRTVQIVRTPSFILFFASTVEGIVHIAYWCARPVTCDEA